MDALLRPRWPEHAERWADCLIREFGSLPEVLAVNPADRARLIASDAANFLTMVQAAMLHCLRTPLVGRPIISTSRSLLDYLGADMKGLRHERFRVLFLTTRNELITDDLAWDGTVGEAPAYPREIIKRALELGATGLILVHNHPSGSHEPSAMDIEATRRISEAASHMGICLHDHLVLSRSGWSSFRAMRLLK